MHSFFSLLGGRVPPPRPGVGNPVAPAGNLPRRRQDIPSSWGTPIVRLLMFFDSGETICSRPGFQSNRMAPAKGTTKALARQDLRSSMAWLSDWLSTLRRPGYPVPRKTRFRPLVRRYRTGFTPAGSLSKVSNSHHVNHPPPPSFLAQASWRNPVFFASCTWRPW